MKSVTQISGGIGSYKRSLVPAPARFGRLPKAISTAALTVLFGLTACDTDYTLAYVYAPSETATISGLINAYGVDNQTGSLRLLPDSPIPSGGRKPTAIAAAPNRQAIYVTNHDDSTVVEFTIGTDGKLYPQNTYNTTGSFPTAIAISADGKYLYIAYTYQNSFTTASPGPGGITVFAIGSDNSLSNPVDFPIGRTPVAIAVSSKPLSGGQNAVYVVTQDSAAVNPAASQPSDQTLNLFAFAASATDGTLSTLPGETIVATNAPSTGYATGTTPGGVLEDASGTHLYVTDYTGNIVISYAIAANGVPTLISGGTAVTGSGAGGMTIDTTGKFLFVANYEGSIGEYTFDANGAPVTSTTAASTAAGTGTTCVTVEPAHGIYVYASGSLSNTITGNQLLPDGTLRPIVKSPYAATTLPVCAVSVARF
jgi:6-phosphogluconolactonase